MSHCHTESNPMAVETLAALRGSIAKWEQIVAGLEGDRGPENCPLCKMFYDEGCVGCPVAEHTLLSQCEGSPYEVWAMLTEPELKFRALPFPSWWANSHEARAAAQAELDFLKSLLPTDLVSDEVRS